TLSENAQLKMSSSTLISTNFVPRGNDKIDVTKQVISLMATFKDRGQEFNEETKIIIKTYLDKNKINIPKENR
ncbi:unnamed protein product, partial [Didymodactylos carnosus]